MGGLYNFHSHTYRCGHAEEIDDSEYIDLAIKYGYKKYGFTDHVPLYPLFYGDKKVRMDDSEKDDYLEEIRYLKEKYRDKIKIYSGFEVEYDEVIEPYLCNLKENCDYLIIGQHYVMGKKVRNRVDYPIIYAKKVCSAIESGLFDIVAHPDVFMRFYYLHDKDKDEFLENAVTSSHMICKKAKEYDIPLEINLGAINRNYDAVGISYPTKLFWDIASNYENKVLIGLDVHCKKDIIDASKKIEVIDKYLDLSRFNYLDINYDPVSYRKNNSSLNNSYLKTKNNIISIEERLINNLVSDNNLEELNTLPKSSSEVDIKTYQKRKELYELIKDADRRDIHQIITNHYQNKTYIYKK